MPSYKIIKMGNFGIGVLKQFRKNLLSVQFFSENHFTLVYNTVCAFYCSLEASLIVTDCYNFCVRQFMYRFLSFWPHSTFISFCFYLFIVFHRARCDVKKYIEIEKNRQVNQKRDNWINFCNQKL